MEKELKNLIPDDPLECLKVLKTSANTYCYFNNDQCEYNKELADNIEKALKRLVAIDNVKPSEALEDLEEMARQVFQVDDEFEFYYNKVKQYILKTQELEKENARYKELEELVGCSLDFIFKVLKAPKIYTEGMNVRSEYDNRFKYCPRINQYMLNPYAIEGKRPEFLFIDRWGHGYDLRLRDYKKTWWFKEDKSE